MHNTILSCFLFSLFTSSFELLLEHEEGVGKVDNDEEDLLLRFLVSHCLFLPLLSSKDDEEEKNDDENDGEGLLFRCFLLDLKLFFSLISAFLPYDCYLDSTVLDFDSVVDSFGDVSQHPGSGIHGNFLPFFGVGICLSGAEVCYVEEVVDSGRFELGADGVFPDVEASGSSDEVGHWFESNGSCGCDASCLVDLFFRGLCPVSGCVAESNGGGGCVLRHGFGGLEDLISGG